MVTNVCKLLEVKNLSIDYFAANGLVRAVRDVNFTLARGEILGLAGESGCGKSTLAYGIARLLRPPASITGGEVLYYPPVERQNQASRVIYNKLSKKANGSNGFDKSRGPGPIDVLQLSPRQLRAFRWNELSIVSQSAMNSLNPVLDIGTQIIDVLQTHRPDMGRDARKRRAIDLLKLVGIASDRLRSYPHELSGGMRQRAVIAIALALSPELIIMDEPTTALDVIVQREILQLIGSLCKEFATALIFITHDLSLLIELADRIAVMYAGKIIEMATSRGLSLHPRHPYSYGLLSSFPTLHGERRKMVGIPGSPPDLRMLLPGCPFVDRCPFAFEPCATSVPKLSPTAAGTPDQLVACHLYNPALNQAGIPERSEFAGRYEVLAEGGNVR